MARRTSVEYGNESISQLKGEDRVRKRPAVIFGSDGLEGCEHAVFEILSNSIDEARAGNGNIITLTRYLDKSIECEDFGRGCPVDWNPVEQRWNWELVFCELYAGGKYRNNDGGDYEYSLGLNGLGSCATQYASEYMDVTVRRDGKKYTLHFEKGRIVGELKSEPADRKKTGTDIRWRPDLEVFTDIDIPLEYYQETLRRQAVVNAGVTFRLRNEVAQGKFETQEFLYENGILDYVREIAGEEVGAYLLITFDGESEAALEPVLEKAADLLLDQGALDVLVADTPAKLKEAWAARSSFLEGIEAQTKLLDECDVVVPVTRIPEYVLFAHQLAGQYDFRLQYFGHAGDGNLHIYTCSNDMDREEFLRQVDAFMTQLYAKTMALGGQISGEHGIGRGKVKYLAQAVGETNLALMRGIKRVFDPKGILNPGKVFSAE